MTTADRIRQIEITLLKMTADQKAALKLYVDAPRLATKVPYGMRLLVEYAHLKFDETETHYPPDDGR